MTYSNSSKLHVRCVAFISAMLARVTGHLLALHRFISQQRGHHLASWHVIIDAAECHRCLHHSHDCLDVSMGFSWALFTDNADSAPVVPVVTFWQRLDLKLGRLTSSRRSQMIGLHNMQIHRPNSISMCQRGGTFRLRCRCLEILPGPQD